jgi:1-phosphatidylinositol-4-phosphate 5-kinase
MGIIDTLTAFGGAKKAEYGFKSVFYNSKTISCVPPKDYGNRFYNFMKDKVFN